MNKKALCVGINEYPFEDQNLNGCVNDAYAWADLLVNHFDFPRTNIKMLLDADATKKNMIEGVENLIAGATAGDVLVFTNSSHGSYKIDRKEDEAYDEVICPYDIEDNLLTDDELRQIFASISEGVRLSFICDSCHSGTITRIIPGADERRMRFLSPSVRGDQELYDPWKARPRRLKKYPQSKMKDVLVAACTDIELAYDAKFGDKHHGALTYFALHTIRAANYKIAYAELVKRVKSLLKKNRFPQHPQLEGKRGNKKRQIFT
jgi:hypothetical protein